MERENPSRNMSRRQFLIGMGAVGLIGLGGKLISEFNTKIDEMLFQEAMAYRPLPYEGPTIIKRGGIGFNLVFAGHRNPECYNRTLDFAQSNKITFVRVFFDYPDADYEPEIGTYREDILSNFSDFCKEAASRDMSLIVALSDGYRMGVCMNPNPVYSNPGKEALSPYYKTDISPNPWSYFYTDKSMVSAYMKRTRKIAGAVREAVAPYLSGNHIQLYFEPMNEPLPKSRREMNVWLKMVISTLQEEFHVPCLSGVADPDTVTDPTILSTVHYYPSILDRQDRKILTLIKNKNVLLEEGGEMSRLFGFGLNQDTRLTSYLTDLFFRTNEVDRINKTVRPLCQPSICLYHADLDHDDGYQIGMHLPQSLVSIRDWSILYQGTVRS